MVIIHVTEMLWTIVAMMTFMMTAVNQDADFNHSDDDVTND